MEERRIISERVDNGIGTAIMVSVVGLMYLVGVSVVAAALFFIARAVIRGLLE